MLRHRIATAAGLVLGLATLAASPAFAQNVTVESDDAAYCKKLAAMQERWGKSANTSNSLQTSTALSLCSNERAAEAIPQLEKQLRAAGFNLPERAIGARQQ
jgi:hypothetical protein